MKLELPVTDLGRQSAFYIETLGLAQTRAGRDWCEVAIGNARLRLFTGDHAIPPQHFALNIAENMFEEARTWIGHRAPLLTEGESDSFVGCFGRDAHRLYFADAGGNNVEFIAHHDAGNAMAGPFGPRHILGFAEVGLPTFTPPAVLEALHRELGLHVAGDGTDLSIAGDHEGLLVVAPVGRPWFPTDVPASPTQMHVVIDAGSIRHSLARDGWRIHTIG